MSYQWLEFEVEDGVATVSLNRPSSANAMTVEVLRELMDIAIRCDEDARVRAVLLTGKGKMFCAGADLKGFLEQGERIGPVIKEMTVYLHAVISRFSRMDAPLVVAVNGTAAGGGFSLAITGDLVLAAESAGFVMAYTASGLSPDGSSTFFLPRLVGLRRAQELIITNRRLSAAEALDWGLVNRVVRDGELMAEAAELARRLAQGATAAFGSTKRLLLSTFDQGLETQMEMEAREVTDNARGVDVREGIRAFVEKRTPRFQGRR